MGKKASKTLDNIYYKARMEAAEQKDDFTSREKTSDVLNMDRTRLARIELETITPYPEEVLAMANHYNCPELLNAFCSRKCPIGKDNINEIIMDDFDRLALKVLGSLKDIDNIRMELIAISEDGVIEESEETSFYDIIEALDKIATNASALKIWAQKNIKHD